MPGWLAVMEHVPPVTSVIAVPETVHMEALFEENATASPEVAVALRAGGVVPRVWVVRGPKVIVCVFRTAKV